MARLRHSYQHSRVLPWLPDRFRPGMKTLFLLTAGFMGGLMSHDSLSNAFHAALGTKQSLARGYNKASGFFSRFRYGGPPEVAGIDVPPHIAKTIYDASRGSRVPYNVLARIAAAESGFNPKATNADTGACGLFQIIPDTTLRGLVYKHGNKYGYGTLADQIKPQHVKGAGMQWIVTGKNTPQQLRSACHDAGFSSNLIVEYHEEAITYLETQLDRSLGPTDIYFGHFLGPAGAARFLAAYDSDHLRARPASHYVDRDAILMNKSIFYNGKGKIRTVGEVYDLMAAKMGEKSPSAAQSILTRLLPPSA